jgi:hypothetical protein
LLGHNLLLGVEFGVLAGEVVLGHDGVLLLLRHVLALHPWLLGSPVATVVGWASSVVVAAVVSALTATTLLVLTLSLVLVVIVRVRLSVVLHVATLSTVLLAAHLPAHVVHLVAAFGLIANLFSMSDPIHHLV